MFKKLVWSTLAQRGELTFHKKSTARSTDEFLQSSKKTFEDWNLNKSDYAGKTVMDIGCGSKLRSLYFDESVIIVSDPLADKYIKEIPWCDLNKAEKVFSLPAEKLIEELKGTVDLVLCINVLDHCFDTESILNNMDSYLKPDGKILLSLDVDHGLHHLHPNMVSREFLIKWFSDHHYTHNVLDQSEKPYGMGKKFTIIGSK